MLITPTKLSIRANAFLDIMDIIYIYICVSVGLTAIRLCLPSLHVNQTQPSSSPEGGGSAPEAVW